MSSDFLRRTPFAQDVVVDEPRNLNTLYRIGATLAAELDVRTIVQTVTDEATQLTGAEFGAFFLASGSGDRSFTLDALSGISREAFTEFPMEADAEIFESAFRSKRVSRIDDVTLDLKYDGDPGHALVCSYLAVPVISRSRDVQGWLFFGHSRAAVFTEEHERLVAGVAGWAALAIDNAQLLEEAQEARRISEQITERIQRLHSITGSLAQALAPAAVAEIILRESLNTLGASGGVVALLDDRRSKLDVINTSGYVTDSTEHWKTIPVDAAVPLAEAARSGRMVLISTPEELAQRYPSIVSDAALNQNSAWAALPLVTDATCTGVLAFSFHKPRHFNDTDREFLVNLARLCSQALQRAQLFDSEQRARAEAELASRAKDEFLAVLSHELRTPMNAIMGWASMLKTGAGDAALVGRAADVIERNARAQTQLIEDLLDVSRIASGKLRLEIKPVQLADLVTSAVETIRAAADAKGIQLSTDIGPLPAQINGDADRLRQIVWNLVSNAVKFTPRGGTIRVDVRGSAKQAEIAVIDSGVGIGREFLPHVFERFRQADTSTTRLQGGLGLGLAIVRHLVEAHGGTVDVRSEGEHKGTTFRVVLPVRPDVAAIPWA
jgi:signal transduction histidine kinase